MENVFLIDGDKPVTYEQLINDLNEMDYCSSYIYVENNEPYDIFIKIIHSLLYDYQVELLDGDFSSRELNELNINENMINEQKKLSNVLTFDSINDVLIKVKETKIWRLSLYTSGTTGRPKKVGHTFKQLTRNIKQGERFKEDVWGFAYNPTHMAGLQVFFQALLNKNSIVYLFNKSFEKVSNLIERCHVTSISASATFYRNLAPYVEKNIFLLVKRLTFGGEKYDASLEPILRQSFPNARIRNVYATTESGSLFTAEGNLFKVSAENKTFIKINKNNELLIHKMLIGESREKAFEEDWFNTGDIVEVVEENKFKFMSRQSDLIHIGGYKVNPLEVEDIIKEVSGVKDVLVKSRKSSVTGEIVVADVVKDEDTDKKELRRSIRRYTTEKLQEWKVPRMVKFVDQIEVTRTGKKVRK